MKTMTDLQLAFGQLIETFSVALREGFAPFGSSYIEYAAYRDRSHAFESSGVATQRSFYLNRGRKSARKERR
jgi:hypothetical protein